MGTRKARAATGRGALPRGVQRRANGRFRGWAMVDRRRVYGPTVGSIPEATAWAHALRHAEQATAAGTAPPTLGDAVELVLAESPTPATRRYYSEHWNAITAAGAGLEPNTILASVTPVDVELLRDTMLRQVAPATVNRRLACVRRLFSLAIRAGLFEGPNPASQSAVRWPKERQAPMDYFTPQELQRILVDLQELGRKESGARVCAHLVAVLGMTGLRRSELARSTISHWNLASCTVHVQGKRGERTVPYSAGLLPHIHGLVAELGDVGPSNPDSISKRLQTWARRIGDRRLHPHALRHTYGTALVRQGLDLFSLMALMGHKSPQQSQRYFHACGQQLRQAADALQLLPPAGPQPAGGLSAGGQ